jgi:excinuclease ABC subunit C
MLSETVREKLEALPARPGCYLFRDRRGQVLYVGKAKSLRARVRSYFQAGASDDRAFIPVLRVQIGDLETIVTATEKEAAILENNLIKENQPRFNVKLRDDKEYLSLKLSTDHPWPRLDLVRRPEKDGARYFGPYHSATSARRTLHLVEKHFQLRTCSDRELESRKRPCLQYQIKRCPAPCVYDVDPELYAQQVRAVGLFLDGKHDELSAELEQRMQTASADLEFELAAMYRDQLSAVQSVREAQRVVSVSDRDQDVLGMYREGELVELSTMYIRSGRVVDVASFSFAPSNPRRGGASNRAELPDEEIVAAFVREHYGEGGTGESHIPDELILPVLPEAADGIAEWLSEKRQSVSLSERDARAYGSCKLLAPERGLKKHLLNLATENARHAFEEKRRAHQDVDLRLARLQERLRLPTLPRRIECCDISHLGGRDTVGAVVSLLNGVPDTRHYRTYHVQGASESDDYAAMYEVLGRRFRRGKEASEDTAAGQWDLPDLFVVDGGRGQLGVALAAASDLGLHELKIVALAKEREWQPSESEDGVESDQSKILDRVYLPGQKNPILLRPNSNELFVLARARDEAHRFANRGRKKLGHRRRFSSELDQVPGIGPKTRTALLKALGSVPAIRQATDEQILAVPGVTRRQLAALRRQLGSTGISETARDGAESGPRAEASGGN